MYNQKEIIDAIDRFSGSVKCKLSAEEMEELLKIRVLIVKARTEAQFLKGVMGLVKFMALIKEIFF